MGYLRPILFASGQQLGLEASPEYTFMIYVSPTGNYFKGKVAAGLKLNIETNFCRAAAGGVGHVKISGNYGITMLPLKNTKAKGYNDNVFLDLATFNGTTDLPLLDRLKNSVVQEMSAANVFLVFPAQRKIVTPSLARRTILPGITRNSVLSLCRRFEGRILEAMGAASGGGETLIIDSDSDVKVCELETAGEVFATGTAAELVPIQSFEHAASGFRVQIPHGAEGLGPVSSLILQLLRDVKAGREEDIQGWTRDPNGAVEDFIKPSSVGTHKCDIPLLPDCFEAALGS